MADDVVETIAAHYSRQATPEIWAEVDELRAALRVMLEDVGCAGNGLCPHWVKSHVDARRILGFQP